MRQETREKVEALKAKAAHQQMLSELCPRHRFIIDHFISYTSPNNSGVCMYCGERRPHDSIINDPAVDHEAIDSNAGEKGAR